MTKRVMALRKPPGLSFFMPKIFFMEKIKWIPLPQMPKDSNDDILVWLSDGSCWMGRYKNGHWDLYYSDQGLSTALDYHLSMITHWALLPGGPH